MNVIFSSVPATVRVNGFSLNWFERFQHGQQTMPLTGNRGTSWTLLFWTSAAGESLAPLVIFPEPLSAQKAELGLTLLTNTCTENNTDIQPRMTFAPNGWMNTSTFEQELRNILPELRKKMPFDQAGVLIFAHTTHISNIAKFFGFHLLTIMDYGSLLETVIEHHAPAL